MSGFDSSIGSKRFSSNQMREFVVPDGEDDFDRQVMSEEDIWKQRKAKIEGKERISPSAKNRIEYLCNISRGTTQVDIDGIKFGLRTLKTKEVRQALVEVAKFDGTVEATFEVRRQFLARALYSIDDQDIDLVLGSNDLSVKLNFVDELDDNVISKLHSEYTNFSTEQNNKYFAKTQDEMKEVSEDLKK